MLQSGSKKKTAYEVSISNLELINKDDKDNLSDENSDEKKEEIL